MTWSWSHLTSYEILRPGGWLGKPQSNSKTESEELRWMSERFLLSSIDPDCNTYNRASDIDIIKLFWWMLLKSDEALLKSYDIRLKSPETLSTYNKPYWNRIRACWHYIISYCKHLHAYWSHMNSDWNHMKPLWNHMKSYPIEIKWNSCSWIWSIRKHVLPQNTFKNICCCFPVPRYAGFWGLVGH